jgi:DNA-binding PucR family transcriptional regulator
LCTVHNYGTHTGGSVPQDFDVEAWMRDLVATTLLEGEFERLVRRLDDEIMADIPAIAEDPELAAILDHSTRGQLTAFVAAVISQPTEIRPAPEAFAFAREIARRGLEMSLLLRVYRSGQQAALRYVTELVQHSDADLEVRPDALIRLWGNAIDWFNISVEYLIAAYAEEREAVLRSTLARRAQVVDAILVGDPVDQDDASALLGHPLRAQQTALIVWAEDRGPDQDQIGRLEAVAARIAAKSGAPRPLVIPQGSARAWAWLATERGVDVARIAADQVRASDKVRVAHGTTAPGPAGFRASHREATAAVRLARDLPRRRVVGYGEFEVLSLVSHDRAAMEAFVRRELGGLARPDAATARLRETVLAIQQGGINAAAGALNLHRNTVRYRLQQAEALLGHSLDERRLEVELALRCAAVFD